MRLVSRKGNFQLHKQTPRRIVNMKAIQTRKEGVFSLEKVISRDPAVAHHTAKFSWHCHQSIGVCCQLRHALLPILLSPLSGGVLIIGEDVQEFHLEAFPFVINHNNLLAGQRECLLLFEMSPRPTFYGAFERVSRLIHRYVRHTHRHSKLGTSLCSWHCLWGAGGRSL